jgi:NIMA (never in mitosis gene a)-related kinase
LSCVRRGVACREDAVNEIRVLASIRHKNVVRYCDAFVEKDNLYIVMEFAERGDIYHKIKKYKEANRCMREEVIWSYFIQMCQGILELHSRRILHRVRC